MTTHALARIRTRATLAVLVLAAGAVACDDVTGAFTPVAFGPVSAGGDHACALSTDGAVFCWGANTSGQLGTGGVETSVVPVRVTADSSFTQIASGERHTCALTGSGVLFCWGWNFYGQLGNKSTIDQGLPIPVAPETRFQSVSTGWFHTCAITVAGEAFCWGANGQGQLGNGGTQQSDRPVRVASGLRFSSITAGGFHTCGLTTARTVYCWGLNHQGQLGTGMAESTTRPARVDGGGDYIDVSAGYAHTCGVLEGGAPRCWGSNGAGELGVAFVSPPGVPGSTRPADVLAVIVPFVSIDAGLELTCGVTTDARGWCWGEGSEGQLGTGAYTAWSTPQPVANVPDFAFVSAGGDKYACGFTRSSDLFCWGSGQQGQLGSAGAPMTAAPRRVRGTL
ncbi:MAG: RCC1 domain-containing protein [Longimicrobiales bacterium]